MEAALNTRGNRSQRNSPHPVTNRLHPRVYKVVIALTAWFALAIWSFSGTGVVDYLLVIISGFLFVAVMLPLVLSRVGQADPASPHDQQPPHADEQPSLREWAAWDYDTRAGRLSGAQATAQILLPIAAAAVGMTVIGLIYHFTGHPVA